MTSQADQGRQPRIVVGVDGSEESRAAPRWAADEADIHDADPGSRDLPGGAASGAGPHPPGHPSAIVAAPVVDLRVFARRAKEALDEAVHGVHGDKVRTD